MTANMKSQQPAFDVYCIISLYIYYYIIIFFIIIITIIHFLCICMSV